MYLIEQLILSMEFTKYFFKDYSLNYFELLYFVNT